MKLNIATFLRRCAPAITLALIGAAISPSSLSAQTATADSALQAPQVTPDSAPKKFSREDSVRAARSRFYNRFAAGAVVSILLHESAHFASAYAMGYHPHLGFYGFRPTVFSGIDESGNRHDQFVFSGAGLAAQELLDELILDIPHRRGSAFERGILAGGIGTTIFYVSLGRNAQVSDISVMSRTSSLSKTQLSLIFGSVAALHAARMSRDHAYSHFFIAPSSTGGLKAGVSIRAN